MKVKQWKVSDFGNGWTGPEIGEEVSKITSDGWNIHEIIQIPDQYRLSKRFDDVLLSDGDTVCVGIFTRVWFNR